MSLAGCEDLAERIQEVVETAVATDGLTYPEVIGVLSMVMSDIHETSRCVEDEYDDDEIEGGI
jgi:hypothetical protein